MLERERQLAQARRRVLEADLELARELRHGFADAVADDGLGRESQGSVVGRTGKARGRVSGRREKKSGDGEAGAAHGMLPMNEAERPASLSGKLREPMPTGAPICLDN